MNVSTHTFPSTKPDPADPTLVRASAWNDGHQFINGNLGAILVRDTGAVDYGANWITSAQGVLACTGVGVMPAWTLVPSVTTLTATTGVQVGNGTAALPSLSFTSDPDTGIYWLGSGALAFTVNAAARLRFDGDLRLGLSQSLGWSSNADPSATAADLLLFRDAAHVLAVKDGANANTLRLYGTTAGAKYLALTHDGTNATISASSGQIQLGAAAQLIGIGKVPVQLLDIVWNQNGTTQVNVANQTSGTASRVDLVLETDTAQTLSHYILSTTYTTSGMLVAGRAFLDANISGGLWLGSRHAAGTIHFFTGGLAAVNERWQIALAGHLTPIVDNSLTLGDLTHRIATVSVGTSVQIGTPVSSTGALRLAHGAILAARNSTDAGDRNLITWGSAAADALRVGDPTANGRLATDMATPGTLANGDWWVESNTGAITGASGSLRARLNGATVLVSPAIRATGRSTAQAGAVASVSTFTVGAADASFEVSANVLVTTATNHAFTVECAYTDEGNTARTLTLTFGLVAGGVATTSIANANGTVPYHGVPVHIRCKSATTITIRTQAAGTYTTVVYNVEGIIRQLTA